jgi:hypothetical protein
VNVIDHILLYTSCENKIFKFSYLSSCILVKGKNDQKILHTEKKRTTTDSIQNQKSSVLIIFKITNLLFLRIFLLECSGFLRKKWFSKIQILYVCKI